MKNKSMSGLVVSVRTITLCMFVWSPITLMAMDFQKNFYLPTSVDYDTNIRMTENDKESVSYYSLVPRLTFLGQDELNTINLDASLLYRNSSNERLSQDRRDPSLRLNWARDFERAQLTTSANYNKSSTRVSELTATGLVFNDESSVSRSLNANLSYQVTDKFTTSAGVGFQKQSYSGGGLAGYQSKSFNTSLSYAYSDTLSPFVRFSTNDFKRDSSDSLQGALAATGQDSKSRSVSAGLNYQYSPVLSFVGNLGINKISTQSGSAWIGSLVADYALSDKSSMNANLSRSVNPSGLGGFQQSDALSVSLNHQLSNYDRVGTSFSWNINRSINDARIMHLSGFYNRDLSEDWSARINYQYRNIDSSIQQADAHVIGASIIYNKLNF